MDKKRIMFVTATVLVMAAVIIFPSAVPEKQTEEVSVSVPEVTAESAVTEPEETTDVSEPLTEAVSGDSSPAVTNIINSDKADGEPDKAAMISSVLGESGLKKYESMPKMDGGSLNSSLEVSFKAKMLGLHYSEALILASEHSDKEAFEGLVSGENDIIFSAGITDEQKKLAEKSGVKLVSVPVAKEGLVFIVNKNNPVDSVTGDQLRDIYSGKITNWNDAGGNDEIILPFQRTDVSDSQKYFRRFLNGTEPLKPLSLNYNRVSLAAVYNNLENALGYTVYSFAARMYENSPDIKYLAVDGIKPTTETMNDGTYPVVSTVSAVYAEGASQDTKNLVEWILSEEGQVTVSECGFIPVKETEYPDEMQPYYSKGTGKEKPADYRGSGKGRKETPQKLQGQKNPYIYHLEELVYSECMLTGLKNTELQDQINADIKELVFGGSDVLEGIWHADMYLYNGYMNICFIKTKYSYLDDEKPYIQEECINLNYDLINGKRVEHFSDLFFKDEEFADVINKRISDELNGSVNLRSDFLGMIGDITNFGFENIYLDKYQTGSDEIIRINFHSVYDSYDLMNSMVISDYYDTHELFDEGTSFGTIEPLTEGYSPGWVMNYAYGKDGRIHYDFFSRTHTESEAEERNGLFESIYEKSRDLYTKEFPDAADSISLNSDVSIYDNDYALRWFLINAFQVIVKAGSDYPVRYYLFDPDTLEQVRLSDIFGKDFEKYDDQYYCGGYSYKSGKLYLYRDGKELELDCDFTDLKNKYL